MDTVETADLTARMKRNVGRYAEKLPDWDAFPASRGFPELARSQVRYMRRTAIVGEPSGRLVQET